LWKGSEQSGMVTNLRRNNENKREHHRIEQSRKKRILSVVTKTPAKY
jgi:hypothetical protein